MTLEVVQQMVQQIVQQTVEVVQETVQETVREVEQHQQGCSVGWRMSQVRCEPTRGAVANVQFQDSIYDRLRCLIGLDL